MTSESTRGSTVTVHQLPLEVSARIFQYLKVHGDDAVLSSQADITQSVRVVMADQACFHQLKLVCSRFNSVFDKHSELSSEINLGRHAARTFVPSILLWIHRWRSSIYRFNSFYGEQHLELVLGALACPCSSLASVFLTNPPESAVCALPAFLSLKQCDIEGSKGLNEQLDVSALQELPSLQELYLSTGSYSSVPSSGHLTKLWVSEGRIQFSENSDEGISLKFLSIYKCSLSGLHNSGLAACKSLLHLDARACTFTAALEDDKLRVGLKQVASIPANISQLTCLTGLDLSLTSCSNTQFDLEWVYSLVALKDLQLVLKFTVEVSSHLTCLTDLTSLKLTPVCKGQVTYCVDWEAMQALARLELTGSISFDTSMLLLTSVTGLRCVNLKNLRPCAANSTVSVLARLMYQLAAKCPKVKVHVDGNSL